MDVMFGFSPEKRRLIGNAGDVPGCWDIIRRFLKDHNYKSYYQRISEQEDGSLWIDVDSWSEFFWIIDGGKKLTIEDTRNCGKIEAD